MHPILDIVHLRVLSVVLAESREVVRESRKARVKASIVDTLKQPAQW